MSDILVDWLDAPLADRIALTLAHFLWQGMIIAVLTWLVGLTLRNSSANARYAVFCGGLLVMFVCAFVTIVLVDVAPKAQPAAVATTEAGEETGSAIDDVGSPELELAAVQAATTAIEAFALERERDDNRSASLRKSNAYTVENNDTKFASETLVNIWRHSTPFIVSSYLLGVIVLLGRLLLGLRGGWKLRRHSQPVDDASLLSLLARRAHVLGMRVSPALCHCRDIAVPTVVGVLRPTILLPMSLVAGLTPDQLEAVLTHELAHIRRYDHMVNIVQRVIEALLFFHPAVWWMSRQIRLEREHCCDDVVLQLGAEPNRYAELLVEIAEHDQLSRPIRSVALVAALQATAGRSQVSQRVRRLLGVPASNTFRLSHSGVASLVVITILLAVALGILGGPEASRATDNTDQRAAETTALPPRAVVAEFLKLIKSGENKQAFDLTTPDGHAGWSKQFIELEQFDSIRPLHQLSDGEKAVVVSNTYADDAGRGEVFTAVLHKHGDRWLIQRHFRSKPEQAFLFVEGFKTNTGVRFSLVPDELVGRWRVNVCWGTVMLKPDGTGSRLLEGPGGPEPDAVAEPIVWSIHGDRLTLKSGAGEDTLAVDMMDADSIHLVSIANDSGQLWVRTGSDPDVLPAKTISLDARRPFLNLATGGRFAPPKEIPLELPIVIANDAVDKPNALQQWAEARGVTIGLVEYDGKPYLQFFNQHAYPISNLKQAAYHWNTMTADEIRAQYREGGFGMLPFEAYFQIELDKSKLPQTWQLVNCGLLRVDQFTGGDNPSVTLQVKLLTPDTEVQANE